MLNKVKVGIVVAAILSVLRIFFTDVTWTDGLEESVVIVIVFFSQFFIKETKETVAKLKLKVRRPSRFSRAAPLLVVGLARTSS